MPVEGQIRNADVLPKVCELAARAVDDAGDFVSEDKLEVLG